MPKKIFTIIFACLFLNGCINSSTKCGAQETKDTLLEVIKGKYTGTVRNYLALNIKTIEENKSDKASDERSCIATVEVGYNENVMKDYASLLEKISSLQFYRLKSIDHYDKDTVTVTYKVKKNEASDGYFISGIYSSKKQWKMGDSIIRLASNQELVRGYAWRIDQLSKVWEKFSNQNISAKDTWDLTEWNNLEIEYCEEVGKGDYTFETTCRISNEAGYFDIVYIADLSAKQDIHSKAFIELFELSARQQGQSLLKGRSRTTGKEKLKAKLSENQNMIFSLSSTNSVSISGACSKIPALCAND